MIKLGEKTRVVREVKAPYEYCDEKTGELTTGEVRVLYYSLTTKERKDLRAKFAARAKEDPNDMMWFTEQLALEIQSLPDIAGPDGNEIEITEENLDLIDAVNIEHIRNAISEDIKGGKALPPK